MIEWTTIIVALVSAVGAAGGVTSLITMKEKKKEKQLDNKDHELEMELKLVNELQEQIERLNERMDKKDERITELEDSNAALRSKLDEANTAAVKAALLRCNRLACERRSPPLGYAELTPEEMLIERKRLAAEKIEDE